MSTGQAEDFLSWMRGKVYPGSVLIVLNQPISQPRLFHEAWTSCEHHVVTDGAANHLKAISKATGETYIPDFIVGDFDSIEDEARNWYVSQQVPFITDKDVNATDFMKAMQQSHLRFDKAGAPEPRRFLAFGALGGRIDHTWHSYFCLSLAHKRGDELVLASKQSVTWLVPSGKHVYATPHDLVGTTCGYAPLEGSATVTTGGFEWDVENYFTSFTTRLSTSNILRCEEVWIETDKPSMFTVEIRKELQN